jgi:cytochrome c-type biogenesis protein CcmF
MIAELGQIALILALLATVVQAVVPMIGAHQNNAALMGLARPAVMAQALFVTLAFVLLAYLMLVQDFSVAYVAQNSNLRLPWEYRISAVWGAHEGSLLLWIWILSAWTVAVSITSKKLPDVFISRVLAVLGIVSIGFLIFTMFTSNPFARLLPAVADGNDLNPLLQDPGLIIHPPMLYSGYVGFSVAFAFAIAALLGGSVDQQWVRWSRPWTNIAWSFLTLGIALGSWWAYYELGWGGWWFWDPVENASFMPWLIGVALIHSQAVTEKRGSFRAWTLLLAISAFSFSLLGTFLVRSGVLTSVHAFASDPERGMYILIFLGVIVGGSLLLYALRAPKVEEGKPFHSTSRESFLLANNLLFACATAMVLLGTLYPLIGEALGLGRISVGAPYFGVMFLILMVPIGMLLPLGPFVSWGSGNLKLAFKRVMPALWIALLAMAITWAIAGEFHWKVMLGVAGAVWVGLGIVIFALLRWRQQPAGRRYTPEMLGMILAHFGVAIFFAGVLIVEASSIEKDLRMGPNESVTVGVYEFRFDPVSRVQGPNYIADEGDIRVLRNGVDIATLRPQKRQYLRQGNLQTESAIDPGFTRDIYVALGEPLDDNGAWSVRVYVKPFIRWIWLGALLMMLGGFVAAADSRFRKLRGVAEPTNKKEDDMIEMVSAEVAR